MAEYRRCYKFSMSPPLGQRALHLFKSAYVQVVVDIVILQYEKKYCEQHLSLLWSRHSEPLPQKGKLVVRDYKKNLSVNMSIKTPHSYCTTTWKCLQPLKTLILSVNGDNLIGASYRCSSEGTHKVQKQRQRGKKQSNFQHNTSKH